MDERLVISLSRFRPDSAMQQAFDVVHGGGEIPDNASQDVRNLVEGLLKLNLVGAGSGSNITDVRNMFFALATDVRVAVMKLAERCVQMSDPEFARGLAFETLHLYVPVAKILGFYDVKRELEDSSFEYLYPREFAELRSQMEGYARRTGDVLNNLRKKIEDVLIAKGFKIRTDGRVKNLYRIFMKLKKKNCTLVDDLFDVIAFRVIIPDDGGVYEALDAIHAAWRPVSGRFKDYVEHPKPNGYRSLHTTIEGLGDRPVEIQIRTESMHRDAEAGAASHTLYEFANQYRRSEWIFALISLQGELGVLNISDNRVFALTPKGDVRDLPRGATSVDFAYSIHSDIGDHLYASKVNGAIAPLSKPLETGDIVEVITKSDARPRAFWLEFTHTKTARNRINRWLKHHDGDELLKKGRDALNRSLERMEKPPLDPLYRILKSYGGNDLSVKEREDILRSIGGGAVSASAVIRSVFFERTHRGGDRSDPVVRGSSAHLFGPPEIEIDGERGFAYRCAGCCLPKQGQKIAGYITRGRGVTLHLPDCPTFKSLERDRIVAVRWAIFG